MSNLLQDGKVHANRISEYKNEKEVFKLQR